MRELRLHVKPVTESAMAVLEGRGLVKRLFPPPALLTAPEGTTCVERMYVSDSCHGAHMLICVSCNQSKVDLAVHPDKEEFLLINEGRPQKPLILVIALHRELELQRLIADGQLTEGDIWALEMQFNDPRLSFFTMNALTPHCEWTVPGPGPANIFFVTEPSLLGQRRIDMGNCAVRVEYNGQGL